MGGGSKEGGGAAGLDAGMLREEAVRRAFPRNLAAMVSWEVVWGLGSPLCAMGIVAPAYLLQFGASKTAVQAVMAGLTPLALLQLLSGRICHGPRRRNRLFGIWMALPCAWLALGLLGLLAGDALPAHLGPVLLVATCAVVAAVSAVGSPAYWEFMLDATPLNRRGRLSALRSLATGVFALLGSSLALALMARWRPPLNFHVCFAVGGALMAVSCLSLLFIRDRAAEADGRCPPPGVAAALRAVPRQKRFLVFLAFHACMVASAALGPILIGFGRDYCRIGAQEAGRFTLASQLGVLALGPTVPLLADRFGFRLIAVIASAVGVGAWLVALAGAGSQAALLVAYGGLTGATVLENHVLGNLGSELAPAVQPSILIACAALVAGPAVLATGPAAGWLADTFAGTGYRVVFAAGAALAAVALAGFLAAIREPRTR